MSLYKGVFWAVEDMVFEKNYLKIGYYILGRRIVELCNTALFSFNRKCNSNQYFLLYVFSSFQVQYKISSPKLYQIFDWQSEKFVQKSLALFGYTLLLRF